MAVARSQCIASIGLLALACGGNEVQHIDPSAVAMTDTTAAFYDDGEVTLYEVQAHVQLPVRAPTAPERDSLRGAVGPFDHKPFVTTADIGVQVTWTLANLDKETHVVKLIVNPWNEFGVYVPGVTVVGEEAIPNLAGFESMYEVPGVGSGKSSRVTGTLTYDDMNELATDFATVIDIIGDEALVPMAMPTGGMEEEDPRVQLVNHTFNIENRHGSTPYTDKYTPKTIPALVGFDIGLQTSEPGNVVVEYALEVVDKNGDRILPPGDGRRKLEPREGVEFSLGTGGY